MLGQKTTLVKSLFNAGILTTFGKLDRLDIDKIDGNPARLVTRLTVRYGWNLDIAQGRADKLSARLLRESEDSNINSNQRVGS